MGVIRGHYHLIGNMHPNRVKKGERKSESVYKTGKLTPGMEKTCYPCLFLAGRNLVFTRQKKQDVRAI